MRESTVLVVLLLGTLGTGTDGNWQIMTLGILMKRQLTLFCICSLCVGLQLKQIKRKTTCSSVNISWTPEDNRTTDFRILYNSTVHGGIVNYRPDASPPYTAKLTDLVADREYTITVIARYSDNLTVNNTINVTTNAGTPSEKGMYIYWITYILDKTEIVNCTYRKHKMDYRKIEHNSIYCSHCSHT